MKLVVNAESDTFAQATFNSLGCLPEMASDMNTFNCDYTFNDFDNSWDLMVNTDAMQTDFPDAQSLRTGGIEV